MSVARGNFYKKNGLKIIGEFRNSSDSRYVLYRFYESPIIYITGDELSWETDWVYEEGKIKAYQTFSLSTYEARQATDIIRLEKKGK